MYTFAALRAHLLRDINRGSIATTLAPGTASAFPPKPTAGCPAKRFIPPTATPPTPIPTPSEHAVADEAKSVAYEVEAEAEAEVEGLGLAAAGFPALGFVGRLSW